jgi:hypothetical protein
MEERGAWLRKAPVDDDAVRDEVEAGAEVLHPTVQ